MSESLSTLKAKAVLAREKAILLKDAEKMAVAAANAAENAAIEAEEKFRAAGGAIPLAIQEIKEKRLQDSLAALRELIETL